MGMYKRYEGEFLSRKGVTWRAEIWQEGNGVFLPVGELCFPAESPLTFEWGHTDKENPICGSTATLTIVSPGDRTYQDLFTIKPGCIRLDAYRNGILYWSGTLDPEFYEEPYSMAKEYEVNLTFSDFGILDRYKYALGGIQDLQTLTEYALSKAGINYLSLEQGLITTSLAEGGRMTLNQLSVKSENFFDEDGEASTLYEMLEGILQPLGLRIVQKRGKIWVYDLNGLYQNASVEEIQWADSDQMMGTDKVANNAQVTFSPYAKSRMLTNKIEYGGEYSEDKTNLTNEPKGDGLEYYSYYPEYKSGNADWDYKNISFTIFTGSAGSGLEALYSGSKYFHIVPMFGGSECDGVAYSFYSGGHGSLASGFPKRKLSAPGIPNGNLLMRTKRIPIQKLSESDQQKFRLRLSMEVLIDPRYNPFSDASDGNEKGNYNTMKIYAGYVMIPATVTLYDENGTALMHYSNEWIAKMGDFGGVIGEAEGQWMPGAATFESCWLSWYDMDDRAESSGILGWKSNKHCIGLSTKEIVPSFKERDPGQYIPYPPVEGYIEICIYTGARIYDYKEGWDNMQDAISHKLWDKIRWMLYKAPVLDIVKNNILGSESESEDVEYNGVINEDAKEELSIDTICGTTDYALPTALGIYLRSDSHEQVKELCRAGRKTQVEQLLIGTLYSQYASRKTKLTGTADILKGELCCYEEACQPGKRFICLEDIQNVIADESSMEIVELRPDEYQTEGE